VFSDHFRMSGVYWALTALSLLPGNRITQFMSEDEIVAWISNCKKRDGSYSHNVHHDGCLLATLSAVQILVLLRRQEEVDADAVAHCAQSLLLSMPFVVDLPMIGNLRHTVFVSYVWSCACSRGMSIMGLSIRSCADMVSGACHTLLVYAPSHHSKCNDTTFALAPGIGSSAARVPCWVLPASVPPL
jgi:hypothetical protein